jgi:hypothetical protein
VAAVVVVAVAVAVVVVVVVVAVVVAAAAVADTYLQSSSSLDPVVDIEAVVAVHPIRPHPTSHLAPKTLVPLLEEFLAALLRLASCYAVDTAFTRKGSSRGRRSRMTRLKKPNSQSKALL